MKMNVLVVFVSSFMLFSGIQHQAFAEVQAEKSKRQQLFETNCKRCHSIERPKSKRKTRGGWIITVMRMKNFNGCPISDEEAALIIDYLATEYGHE